MPNDTTNIMYVSGPRPSLQKFRDTVSGNNPVVVASLKEELEKDIAKKTEFLKKEPNNKWVQRGLKEITETLDQINKGTYDGKPLDFNGTVPMPHSLNITEPPHTDEEKRIAEDNIKKYGHPTWYPWRIANYGTKWGAYEVEEVEDLTDTLIYRFQTAWSPPTKWIETTSIQFPDLTFLISAADEGGGFFIKNTIINGDTVNKTHMSEHDWYMEHDACYKETYDNLFNSEYEDGIKYALDCGEINWNFEEKFLNMIKDEDLPLFTSFDWNRDDIAEAYAERVRSIDLNKTKSNE